MMLWGMRWVWSSQMQQGELLEDRMYVGLGLRWQASATGTDSGVSTAYRRSCTWQRTDNKKTPSQTKLGEPPSAHAPQLNTLHPSLRHPSYFSGFPEVIHAHLPFFPFSSLKDILCGWHHLIRTKCCSSSFFSFCFSQGCTLKVTNNAVLFSVFSVFTVLTHAH